MQRPNPYLQVNLEKNNGVSFWNVAKRLNKLAKKLLFRSSGKVKNKRREHERIPAKKSRMAISRILNIVGLDRTENAESLTLGATSMGAPSGPFMRISGRPSRAR